MSEPLDPGAPVAAPAQPETRLLAGAPWWLPEWPVVLATGLYGMAFWLLYVLSPPRGAEPSELFKTLAGAVVITGFINGVVAQVFTSSRDSQKKNETIAAQAKAIADRGGLG